jgi:uncharacterized SAM-binding protein YcdF (DUF218 family)
MKTLAAFLILVMIWVVGLLAFADRIERSTPAPDPPPADAIVALTGATIERVTAAVALLENDKGKRLLVSGVNREVKPAELQAVSKAAKGLFNCCIQMGFEAADTHGNAAETAAWARQQGYTSLIVVTADYHMPRSILEIRRAAPGLALTPYPIATREVDAAHWWKTNPGARRMILEYCKYLAVLGSEAFLKLGPRPKDEKAAA